MPNGRGKFVTDKRMTFARFGRMGLIPALPRVGRSAPPKDTTRMLSGFARNCGQGKWSDYQGIPIVVISESCTQSNYFINSTQH